jgi:hypothetical protein
VVATGKFSANPERQFEQRLDVHIRRVVELSLTASCVFQRGLLPSDNSSKAELVERVRANLRSPPRS